MKASIFFTASMLALAASAQAETPYEKNQREQMEIWHRDHGWSAQELQQQRWTEEWKQQHPGQPVPNLGVLEHLHEGELTAQVKAQGAQMWQARQAELQRNRLAAKQKQEKANAAKNIAWTPQQWKNWDREYDQEMQQRANEYREAVRESGEAARAEAAEDERRRLLYQQQ